MFVGREDYLQDLDGLWRKRISSLVTCRGRRRIGKSTLIEEFARRSRARFVKLEGLHPEEGMDNRMQLDAFAKQLRIQADVEIPVLEDWFEAFQVLGRVIGEAERTVLLLDEISWMGKYDPGFAGELKYAWDNVFSKKKNLVMVLCGSVSSWIDKKILRSKGFVGRPSLNLLVREIPLDKVRAFFGRSCSVGEIIDVLSVVGGVPKYLENIDPGLTAEENIRQLCFRPGGLLVDEFDEIFNDALDENLGLKKRMLQSLADGPLSASEIAGVVGCEYNGHITANLEELEIAGFISRECGRNPVSGLMVKEARYRVSDNYTRFYLKCIEPSKMLIRDGLYNFISLDTLPGWNAVMGLQFESLILNNISPLLLALQLQHAVLLSAAPYRQKSSKRGEGCQIDLLLQTKKGVFVVEIKRREHLGAEVITEVEEKVARLKLKGGRSVRTVLVHSGTLARTVAAENYFDRIVDVEELLIR